MQEILTHRLTLRLMTEEFLEASLDGNLEKTESIIGLKIPQDWFAEKHIARIRLNNYREDSEYVKWGLRAVGLRESNEMVGYIGFHTKPNPEYLWEIAPNAIEFGFTIFSNNRRKGFAGEAAIGLMNWAVEQYPFESFIASVSPSNIASTSMVKKLGFEMIGEQIDEVDGLEIIHALRANK
jgi:RimJ/RimL family protein N-acetyltransferase